MHFCALMFLICRFVKFPFYCTVFLPLHSFPCFRALLLFNSLQLPCVSKLYLWKLILFFCCVYVSSIFSRNKFLYKVFGCQYLSLHFMPQHEANQKGGSLIVDHGIQVRFPAYPHNVWAMARGLMKSSDVPGPCRDKAPHARPLAAHDVDAR